MATLDLAGIITRVCTDLKSKFSKVSVTPSLTSGTKSATIVIDGTAYDLYAPTPTVDKDQVGYQIRSQESTLRVSDNSGPYRLWFTSADGSNMVPINTSTSWSISETKTLNTRPINPFGQILYGNSYTTSAYPAAENYWSQYKLDIRYSYVKVLTSKQPVYLKCSPQNDGSVTVVMNDIVQELPTSRDGFVYVYLGVAYDSNHMELSLSHPVYYHDGTGIKLWNGNAKYSISSLGGTGTNYFWANKGCATLMSSGTTPSAQWGSANVCTIPSGYRPPTTIYLPVQKDGAIASDTYLIVDDDGSVTIQNGGGTQAAVTYRVTATWAYY